MCLSEGPQGLQHAVAPQTAMGRLSYACRSKDLHRAATACSTARAMRSCAQGLATQVGWQELCPVLELASMPPLQPSLAP